MTRYTPLWLQAGNYAAAVDRRLVGALWPGPASAGCAVTPGTAMQVQVAAGQVAVPSQNGTGSTLCASDAVELVNLTAAPGAGTNRIDVVICQPRGNDLDGGANNDFIFTVVTGTAAATPAVPATPAGAVALADIYVGGGVASIVAGNITDVRPGMLAAWPAGAGRGTIAQAGAIGPSTGTTTNVDWFSAPPFTTDGTRRVKATFQGLLSAAAANDVVALRLMEGATVLQSAQLRLAALGGPGQETITGVWQGVPAAGAHTYKLNVAMLAGTGPDSAIATATAPGVLLVEDIGI